MAANLSGVLSGNGFFHSMCNPVVEAHAFNFWVISQATGHEAEAKPQAAKAEAKTAEPRKCLPFPLALYRIFMFTGCDVSNMREVIRNIRIRNRPGKDRLDHPGPILATHTHTHTHTHTSTPRHNAPALKRRALFGVCSPAAIQALSSFGKQGFFI